MLKNILSKSFSGAPGNRSDSDNGLYVRSVERAVTNYRAFTHFKRDPHYRAILEHASREQGQACIDELKSSAPDLLDRIKEFYVNDLVGDPKQYPYAGISPISPTTLRYMKVAADIRNLFGPLEGASIAEVGVGYGGQCLVLDCVCQMATYTLFDLSPVLALASKYLECHILNCCYRTSTLNQLDKNATFDLVISNYAFSELPAPLQIAYINRILSHSKRGYLTMNTGRGNRKDPGKLTCEDLKSLLPPFEVIDERPSTAADNYIICWGNH